MRKLVFILALWLPRNLYSQDLLANGGFEEANVCTEYNKDCAPEAWISSASGFNNYFRDHNRAHSGSSCMAIEAAHTDKKYNRTYLRSRLVCGLRTGNLYKLSFYIKSAHPVLDSTGILFSDTDPLYSNKPMQGIEPSLYLAKTVQSSGRGDSNWRKVEIDYQATGQEVYILIGYFAKADYRGERPGQLESRYFIFLDDFSLLPTDPHEQICGRWKESVQEIYEENERHELIARRMKYYRGRPPTPPELERNTYPTIDTLVLPDIFFEAGKAVLQPSAFAMLDSIAGSVQGKQIDSLVLKGHTDNTGTFAANEVLSMNRAKATARYIAPRISQRPVPVFVYGLADIQPVAGNGTPAGRQKNRRVEILVYLRE